MQNIDAYLGRSTLNSKTNTWEVDLDDNIKDNLNSMCQFILTIFNAKSCRVFASCSQSLIPVAQYGNVDNHYYDAVVSDFVSKKSLDTEVFYDDINASSKIIFPVLLVSESPFIFVEFQVNEELHLTQKEEAIIKLIQANIKNHLLQHKKTLLDLKLKELHHLISKNNKDWIFVKDANFKIVYANDSFISVYPKDKQDKVIGYTTIEEYDEKEAELFLKNDKIAFKDGESIVIENIHMPNKSRLVIETIKRRFEDDKGQSYILCVCRDITEKQNLIAQLEKANNDLDDFTSIASHDLKSPLNAIKRLLEWIYEDCQDILPQESIENLNLVISRASRMRVLLDDLLAFAKIGKESSDVVELNLSKLLEDLIPLLDVPKKFEFNVDDSTLILPSIPFKTVMLNVISNAIKHNDKTYGTINISMETTRHYYIVSVSDNGPGIEAQFFEKIFELFQTLKPRDEVEGSGLGLSSVVKHLNQFGGRIEVESDGKLGATFNIFWPRPKI